jgi:hypothetical protein
VGIASGEVTGFGNPAYYDEIQNETSVGSSDKVAVKGGLMSSPVRKVPDLFYEEMDAAKFQRLQSEYTAVWDEFKRRADAQGRWRIVLHMMINERRSFAEAAAFVGFQYPEGD